MTQQFGTQINGQTVTVESMTLSCAVGRMYDVCTFTTDIEPIKGQTVTAIIADTTFSGEIDTINKKSEVLYEVIARSSGAKLYEPYSEKTVKLENATTSAELFAQYASETGVDILDTTAEIDFYGNFERNGTHATAIEAVASVTGAEIYTDGVSVFVSQNKPIDNMGEYIEENEIFYFSEISDTSDGGLIGAIDINNGGETSSQQDTSISSNAIKTEINKSTGELIIYVSPNGGLDSYSGIGEPRDIVKKMNEKIGADDTSSIELTGPIKSIDAVKVNGAKITNYDYQDGINIINFRSTITGFLDISYNAYAKKTFVTTKKTPDGLFYDYDLVYRDQKASGYGFIAESAINSIACNIISDGASDNVFYAQTNNLSIDVTHNGEPADFTVDVTHAGINHAEDVSFEAVDGVGDNVFFPRFKYTGSIDVSGNSGSYTETTIGGRQAIIFASADPNTKVAYEMDGYRYEVDSSPEDGDYVYITLCGDGGYGYTYSDDDPASCSFPMAVTVDVPYELGVSVNAVVGISMPAQDALGNSYGALTSDRFGIATLNVNTDGRYKIDTDAIIPGSYIVVVVDTENMQW
ncbi:MAG: hypothetical protein WCR98_06745 [Saccharofermentanales bacterium]